MKISRRSVLKSMLAGGVLSAASPFAMAVSAGNARHTVLLTNSDPFAAGARIAGHAEARALGPGLPDTKALHALFTAHREARWFGLVPDDAYVVLSAIARDVGLKQLFEGTHRVDAPQQPARHVLQSAGALHQTSALFNTGLIAGIGWEQAIGHTLARLAAGDAAIAAIAASAELHTTVVQGGPSSTARSLISFVMEA